MVKNKRFINVIFILWDMSSIFNPQEMNALVRSSAGLQRLEDKVDSARKQGLKEAFERIKGDYKLHDSLANLFGDAEGFVLKFCPGTYIGDFERDSFGSYMGEEPPYLSIRNNPPQYSNLLLITQRNRDNHLVLGGWHDVGVRGEGVQSVIEIYEPDVNVQKILHRIGADLLIEPENFALAWLASRGEIELSLGEGQSLPEDRQWKINRELRYSGYGSYEPILRCEAKLEGCDLIKLYKESVREAVQWVQKLERCSPYGGGTGSIEWAASNSQNAKFFNRDRYPTKGIPTKIYSFELRQTHI